MDFGQAIVELKAGNRISRVGWNGKGMWLALIHPGNAMFAKYGERVPMSPCIGMKTVKGDMQPGWLASQADILAEDWVIVE